jgi:alkanesulfonate monooxygenase
MGDQRQLHLGAFMRPIGIHTAWWLYPGSYPDANFNLQHLVRFAQTLERGRFDAFFMADHLAVLNMPMDALKRSATVTSFDPLTLLPALAVLTEHIGLIATASTTYNEPYHIARKFATLDHISGGRAGWNVVTSGNPAEAQNFGREEHLEHATRYRRAREFFDVVTGLWDSWADDAFIRDVKAGVYFDPDKLHVLDHKGEFLNVRGPLNIARPVQGWPVIVQAGASDAGRQLAAETAEVIFGAGGGIAGCRSFYADVKSRMDKLGRNRNHLKVLPGAFVIVGESVEEARAKRAKLDSLVHYDSAIASLSVQLGTDASRFDPDGPLPEIPETNASKSARERLVELAARENMTVRQLAQRAGGYSGLGFVGTPKTIADEMEEWLFTEAADGFNIMFPYVPEGLDAFVDLVVPELQRRGIFRREYEGKTLRENFGLPRPENLFFAPLPKPIRLFLDNHLQVSRVAAFR